MKRNKYEDDGRTIADMSELETQNVFSGLLTFRRPSSGEHTESGSNLRTGRNETGRENSSSSQEDRAPYISPEERKMWTLGAIRAALAVALVYIGVIGGAIALMVLFWKH